MSKRKVDLTGKQFYYLTVICYVGQWDFSPKKRNLRHWECRCSCGGSRVVATELLTGGRVRHCSNCNPEIEAQMYLSNYSAYREAFTPKQRERYESYLRGRKGSRLEAEAVDVTLRELPPKPAVHLLILGDKTPIRLLVERDAREETGMESGQHYSTEELLLPYTRLQAYENPWLVL